jgi:molecular chaperone GrpE
MDTKKKKETETDPKATEQAEAKAAESTETENATENAEADRKEAMIAELQSKLESSEAELASLKEQMLRDRADLENFRKRLVRDKEDAVKYANTNLIKDLLQPLDDFKRAIDAAESTKDFDKIHDGVVMVSSQLFGLLERNWGLEKIEAVGKEFDPELHEACMVVEDTSLSEETVLEDFSTGYKLHGRVLRPSKVKVGKPGV